MTLIKDERKAVHNKQIGNRAGEMLLLSFCPRLNGSNSIQHLCLKSTPSPICKPLPVMLKDDTTDNKLTVKRQTKMPTLRKIKRAASRHTSQRFCSTFNFTQPHPKPTHHPTSGRLTL